MRDRASGTDIRDTRRERQLNFARPMGPAPEDGEEPVMAEHIKIRPAEGTWVVRTGGAVIAESTAALELAEGFAAGQPDVGIAGLNG